MNSIDDIKTEPEFEVKEEPPDEEEDDTFSVQSCMYCQASNSQDSMTNVILNEERLQIWSDSLGVKLECYESNWICKSHFKPTDFTEKGILHVGAIPFKIETSSDLKNQRTSEQCTETATVPRVQRISVRKCVYCSLTKKYPNMTVIRGDPIRIRQWKRENGIETKDGDVLPICKSHFEREDFSDGSSRLKFNVFLKLDKNTTPSNGIKSVPNIVTEQCVYCKSTKHQLNLVEVPSNEELILRWKLQLGVEISYAEVVRNPWVCASHFDPGDIEESRVLKPSAIPLDVPSERHVENCDYCQSTKNVSILIKIKIDRYRLIQWSSVIGDVFNKMKTIWICKTHFNPCDFTPFGKLKKDAIPFDGVPKIRSEFCVWCESEQNYENLASIRGEPTELRLWERPNGTKVVLNDIFRNPFVCKSHFTPDNFMENGTLRLFSIPQESVFFRSFVPPKVATKQCVYCKSFKHHSDLVEVPIDEEQVLCWKIQLGIEISIAEVVENPWVCASHFDPNDIEEPGVLNPHATPLDAPSERIFKKCEYCQSSKNDSSLIKFNMGGERLVQWNSVLGTKFEKMGIIRICRSHFNSCDITPTGKLKKDAIPLDGVARTRSEVCVWCQSKQNYESLVPICEKPTELDLWERPNGTKVVLSDIARNPFICKSHFAPKSFMRNGKLKLLSIPQDSVISRKPVPPPAPVRFEMCLWCHTKQNYADLAPVSFNPRDLLFWERPNGTPVEIQDIEQSPWICKSHFTPYNITKSGTLRVDSVPMDSLLSYSVISNNGPELKCVHCGVVNNRSLLARIVMDRPLFEQWTKAIGYELPYEEVIKNPWICRSHFGHRDVTGRGTLKAEAVPKDGELTDRIVMCIYCKVYDKRVSMSVLNMTSINLAKWMTNAGIEDCEVGKSLHVCNSHFKPNDFTKMGNLKYNSVPSMNRVDPTDDEEVKAPSSSKVIEDLLDFAIQNQPVGEEEEETVQLDQYIPELQDHNYAKLEI